MNRRDRCFWASGLALIAIALLSGCGSGGSGGSATGSSGHGNLTIAVFSPFTGPDAAFGSFDIAGCLPAVHLINNGGGVLGHRLTCKSVDTHGDAADAVPAARQMLASTSNLVGVLGPSSDEASATVPLLSQSKVVMFSDTGQSEFDHSTFTYFWRNEPADDVGGYAMALFGHQKGYTRAAAIFGTDISSQGTLPTLLKAVPKLGGTIVINERLAAGQSSYRSEIERMVAAKPQVIYTEADPQSSATFFAQLKQLHGPIPIIGSNATAVQSWFQAVAKPITPLTLSQTYAGGVAVASASSGPAYQAYKQALLTSSVPQATQYLTDPTAEARYDATTVMALAMLAAHSTNPAVYNGAIRSVTAPRPGAVVVHTFLQGKAMLAAGKKVQYVGPTGPEPFDQWHNSTGAFVVLRFKRSGQNYQVASLTASQLTALAKSVTG